MIEEFYKSPLGAEVRKALVKSIRASGLRTGYDVRTLLVGAPDAHAVAIAEIVLGPVTIAYNEMDALPGPRADLPRAEIAMISNNTLPFIDFMFDQVILLHALEFSPAPLRLMREAQRVLASDGLMIAIAANRTGMWSWFSSTPFGEGMTFSANQMRRMLADAELTLTRIGNALFFPPTNFLFPVAEPVERAGRYLGLGVGGVVVAAAVKQRYAGTPKKTKPGKDAKAGLQWASARATHRT